MRGCFLHKNWTKIRWSVGTDHPKKWGNWPESWLRCSRKIFKLARFPKDSGMLPAQNWTKNQVVSGHWPFQKMVKLTWKLVVLELQPIQIHQVTQRCRDAPCEKLNEKKLVSGHRPSQKMKKNWPVSLLEARSNFTNFIRFPRDPGIVPAAKRGKKMVKYRWSVGTDHPEKWKRTDLWVCC